VCRAWPQNLAQSYGGRFDVEVPYGAGAAHARTRSVLGSPGSLDGRRPHPLAVGAISASRSLLEL
jgi:hypothetical protein